MLADIGPIPESEVERLDPLIIDHTVLQRMNEQSSNMEEEMKVALQKVFGFVMCFLISWLSPEFIGKCCSWQEG